MNYEKKYKEALERAKMYQGMVVLPAESMIETIFPELAESEDELTWLTKYIEEEAYSLSMDIRDNEDRIKLKKLQKALAWLKKQGQKPAWTEDDEDILSNAVFFIREYQTPTRNKTMLNVAKEAEDWLKSIKQRIGG